MLHKAIIGKLRSLCGCVAAVVVISGCNPAPPADTSFGVEGGTFSCVDNECDITFYINNQMPHSVDISYKAVLSTADMQPVYQLSERIEVPALEKARVSRTVSVSEQPERLRVTVTTL